MRPYLLSTDNGTSQTEEVSAIAYDRRTPLRVRDLSVIHVFSTTSDALHWI
jgi:hypothetical protein